MQKFRAIINNDEIPSPPAVAVKLLDLANDIDASLEDIQKVIATDPKLAARIIDYANSPLMGMKRTISSLQQAVVVMGFRSLRLLSLSFSLIDTAEDKRFDLNRFWRESLLNAIANKHLGGRNGEAAEEDFLLGLVFNVGAIAIGCVYPDDLLRLEELSPQDRSEKEYRIFGGTRYQIGARLLEKWNFPEHMVSQLEGYQRRDSQCKSLYLSELVTDLVSSVTPDCSQIEFVREECEKLQGINELGFEKTYNSICNEFREYEALFDIEGSSCYSVEDLEQRAKDSMFKLSMGLESEIQKLSEEKEELESNAHMDCLSNLKNRAAYDSELASAVDYHRRKRKGLSLVVVDIDHFKSVNDTFGHAVGDIVIQTVAEVLSRNLRKYDSIYRYGGEEFVAILVDCNEEDTKMVTERLRASVEQKNLNELGESENVTVSIGAYHVSGENHPVEDLFQTSGLCTV